jgi:DNA-binding PadR family transcriptional regulator
MALTDLEREFLQRLSTESWDSPPRFDHSLVVRLVEANYVQTETLPTGSVHYEITEAGRATIADEGIANPSRTALTNGFYSQLSSTAKVTV